MKRIRLQNVSGLSDLNVTQLMIRWKYRVLILTWLSVVFFCLNLDAQKPVVAIVGWDGKAKEGSDPAEVRIIQVGDPSPGLVVNIATDGTASHGIDYRSFQSSFQMDKMVQLAILPVHS